MVKKQVCAFMILESVFFVYQYLNTVIPPFSVLYEYRLLQLLFLRLVPLIFFVTGLQIFCIFIPYLLTLEKAVLQVNCTLIFMFKSSLTVVLI